MALRDPRRQELEAQWRQRVKTARDVYLKARAQHATASDELGQGFIAPADGLFAVASARRAEALALGELTRTIQAYADLVVKGIVPPSDEDQKLIG